MDKPRWVDWVTLGVILLLTVLYISSLSDVPFHPDESTHIYMSKDISINPLELAWDGTLPLSDEARIRAIDAPLTKYMIGSIRGIFSIPPLAADWNWSLDWEENQAAGALPTDRQLIYSRIAMVLLLPISLWLYFLALKKILPAIPSLTAVLLLGMNPLLLLHGRRAMSESGLILGITLFLWAVTRNKRNPWLIGLAIGIAVNAKHSALGLIPAALVATIFLPEGLPGFKKAGLNLFKTSLILIASVVLLNPFYWKNPLGAFEAGSRARFSLTEEQQADYLGRIGLNEKPLKTTIPGLILNTYITVPQTEEVGNYLEATRESKLAYLSNPFHNWGRDLISGSVMAALTLIGFVITIRRYPDKTSEEKNHLLILALATVGMGIFIIFLLPWQRYAVAVLPFTFSWAAAGLQPILKTWRKSSQEISFIK